MNKNEKLWDIFETKLVAWKNDLKNKLENSVLRVFINKTKLEEEIKIPFLDGKHKEKNIKKLSRWNLWKCVFSGDI